MRTLYVLVAASLAASWALQRAEASQCPAGNPPASILAKDADADGAICPSMQTDFPASKRLGVQLAQFSPGSCGIPNSRTCVNGWVAVCQCYIYGCNYTPTAYRCGAGVRPSNARKDSSKQPNH